MASKDQQYLSDSKKLVELLGRNNIISATHCITRVRLVLKDTKDLDIKAIEALDSVQGTFSAGGQFQVIIGTDVPKFFKFFIDEAKIKAATSAEVKQIVQERGTKWQRAIGWFSSIFVPIIPVIVAGGLILAFRNILETDWDGSGPGSSWAASNWFAQGLNNFLWVIGQSIFVFLPVYVVYAIFNKAGQSATLGICIGIMIVAPTMVNLYDLFGAIGKYYLPYDIITDNKVVDGVIVTDGIYEVVLSQGIRNWSDIAVAINTYNGVIYDAATGVGLNPGELDPVKNEASLNAFLVSVHGAEAILGYQINNIGEAINATNAVWAGWAVWPWAIQYNAQVIPAVMIGLFGVWVTKFIERHTWNSVLYVWPPLGTLLITAVMAFGVIGPIGATLQYYISLGFFYGFTMEGLKWVVGPLFALFYAPMVVTGLHYAMNPVMIQLTNVMVDGTVQNANYIFPILALSNMAQGAAVFATVWMARDDKKYREMGVSAGITCWLGVTEPAMYGSNIKYFFPFIAAMLATFVSSFMVIGFDIVGIYIGMGGLLAPLSISTTQDFGVHALWIYILDMVLVVVLGFLFTVGLSRMHKFMDKWASSNWKEYLANIKEKSIERVERKE